MANFGTSLLAHATSTSTTPALNLQIPPIFVKLDRDNYPLRRSTVTSVLETFDLESFISDSNPPAETYLSSDSEDDVAPAPKPNPEYVVWKKRD